VQVAWYKPALGALNDAPVLKTCDVLPWYQVTTPAQPVAVRTMEVGLVGQIIAVEEVMAGPGCVGVI
jgi:flagellar biosynthesis regulator FlbT